MSNIFYYKIRWSRYTLDGVVDDSIILFFKKVTMNSPLGLLSYTQDSEYVGFTISSYIIIVVFYTAALLIMIYHLIEIFVTSMIIQVIQLNKNNNPYKNPNVLTKNNKSPYVDIITYHIGLGMMMFAFLVPFGILYILNFLQLDTYDIKKSSWVPYAILLLLLFPFFYVVSQPYSPFRMVDRYIEDKDKPWVKSIETKMKMQFSLVAILLFIVISFCALHLIYFSRFTKTQLYIILIFIFILFIFIPLLCIYFSYQILLEVDDGKLMDVNDMGKKRVNSLYELLVKYNYPCFLKG